MNGKNQKYNTSAKKTAQRPAQPAALKVKAVLTQEYTYWLKYTLLGGILVITFWCYHYSLNNQFTNWDDGVYIYDNPFVKNLSSQSLKLLLKDTRTGNFHPITMLSLALNWHYSGASPKAYYLTEIIIHLLNTILVFFLAFSLLNAMVKKEYGKIKGIPYLAGLCALWHGIHPMHVESVSWIAERKDVLYLFFYLLGLIVYVKYVLGNKISQLVLVVFLFLLSLLSKPMAVVFPFSLFAIDVLLKRKMEWRLLWEKVPFFLVSVIFSYVTFKFQDKSGAVSSFHTFTILQRIMFVGYNYLMYLGKFFVPLHLSSFYPYPEVSDTGNLPLYFYGMPLLALLITGGLLYLAYRKGENYFRVALFGFGFYFFNVMIILQFVSAGPSIMADRYSYAAYIGLTFALIYFLYVLIEKIPAYKTPIIMAVAAFSCMLTLLCQARTEVWHNTKTLWQDVIAKYPAKVDTVYNAERSQYIVHVHEGVETAYKNLGNYYVQDITPPNYDSAYMNYEVLEETHSRDAGVYSNLGNIWAIRNNMKKSLEEYTKSLALDSKNFDTYLDRAISYSRIGQNDLAMQDYNHAFMLDSNNQRLLENRGFTLLNGVRNYNAAEADYNRLIAIDPANMAYYKNRGLAKLNNGNVKEALEDFNKVINTDPKDKECLYYFSFAYKLLKAYPTAIEYAQKAKQNGFSLPAGYMDELLKSAKTNVQ